jgi:hypothetical protein
MMRIGAMISMKDSGRKASVVDILEDNNPTLRSIHLEEESGLKSKIEGYRRLSAMEWIGKHTEQNELFSKNILTNIAEHSKIGV